MAGQAQKVLRIDRHEVCLIIAGFQLPLECGLIYASLRVFII